MLNAGTGPAGDLTSPAGTGTPNNVRNGTPKASRTTGNTAGTGANPFISRFRHDWPLLLMTLPAVRGDQRVAAPTRSTISETPFSLAQWAQQYQWPLASTPWPMIRHPQCSQAGAMPWIAHSKLS
ncbi:MAG: hypothetical protein JWQ95_2504 [Sphaerisporangium sp.]|nr:hypothetical protein [Sphaerisporangium sp.]